MHAIICLSGGIESTTLAYMLKKEMNYKDVIALRIDYGHRANVEEKFCVRKICDILGLKLIEIDVKWLKNFSKSYLTSDEEIPEIKYEELYDRNKAIERMKWWWIPGRNLLIATIALIIAEHDYLYKGIKRDIFIGIRRELPLPMPDNTEEFIERLNLVFEYAILRYHLKEPIRIYAPLIKMTKDEVVKKGYELGVDFRYTYSCYKGNRGRFINGIPVHCGKCSNCKRRKEAFKKAGVKDPSIYVED